MLGLAVQAHAGAPGTESGGCGCPGGRPGRPHEGLPVIGDNFLPVDQAFRFDAVAAGGDAVRLNWEIADGYYLYRARIKVSTSATNVRLGAPQLPAGQVKNDEYFGRQEIYHHELIATVPVARTAGGALEVPLQVTYQGCADAGLCYPPQYQDPQRAAAGRRQRRLRSPGSGRRPCHRRRESDQNWFATQLRNDGPLVMIGLFYLAGLALAFTPCVLPMVPILSGIIFGGGRQVTTARAFTLSLTYVLGMAVTYTAAGIACAAAGKQVQAIFQQWWVLSLFAALFVALALSMFGLFTLQMPAVLQTRLANISNRQSAGSYGGVAVMGALSALIVTTCVGPALVAALLFISQTGQMVRGGAALFAMSIGMGTPLLIVGASAGKLLPKAGAWMDLVKKLFGVMMLGVAVWMLGARGARARVTLILWAVPALAGVAAVDRAALRTPARLGRCASAALAAESMASLLAGARARRHRSARPPAALRPQTHALPFQRRAHGRRSRSRGGPGARPQGTSVLLDFSADWCTSCKEMERYTFTDPSVQQALTGTVLLRADVTADNADDQALLKCFGIIGPPTIAFYGSNGRRALAATASSAT